MKELDLEFNSTYTDGCNPWALVCRKSYLGLTEMSCGHVVLRQLLTLTPIALRHRVGLGRRRVAMQLHSQGLSSATIVDQVVILQRCRILYGMSYVHLTCS